MKKQIYYLHYAKSLHKFGKVLRRLLFFILNGDNNLNVINLQRKEHIPHS